MNTIANSEITKPLVQKFYKSMIVLYTSPLKRGNKISVDRYQGVVYGVNLWYVKLKTQNKSVFIPTSFIYDKVVELFE